MELRIIELSGKPSAMGESFGEQCREQINQLFHIRLKWAIRYASERGRCITEDHVLRVAAKCLEPTLAYDPDGYEELCGIANGASLSPAQVFVLQGLTDLRDLLAFGHHPVQGGCSSFIVGPDRTARGRMLMGQNWDLQTDNLPYVVIVHRRPDAAPETWSLTVTGALSLIGINSEGICVGNTNLVTRDVRIGVQYLSVIHRVLASCTLEDAAEAIVKAPRAGAHFYYAGGPDGRAYAIECGATRCVRSLVENGVFVHCNHALTSEIQELEAQPPSDSSLARQERLTELLAGSNAAVTVREVKRMLSDHENGELSICRHDIDNINTNACVIMCPENREIHACRGQAHLGKWLRIAI